MPDEPQVTAPLHEEDDDNPIFESFRSRDNRFTRLSESIFGNEEQQLREQIGLDAANVDAGTVDDDRFYRNLRRGATLDLPPQMLERAQRLSVLLWRKNVRAFASVELKNDFTLGNGINVTAPDDKVQQLLTDHWEINEWEENIEERLRTLALFGEQLYPVFVNEETGIVRVSVVTPTKILKIKTNPINADEKIAIETSVGVDESDVLVRSRAGPKGKVFGLIRMGDDAKLTYNTDEPWAFYFAINRISGSTRGQPDLLSAVDWLEGLDGFIFGLLERADISQDVVYDITYEGLNEQEIRRQTKNFANSLRSGGIYGHNEKVKLEIKNPNLGSSDAETAARILLRQIQSGTRLAGLFYGDAADLTRSSASELSVPVAKMIDRRQMFVRRMFTKMFRFQIEQAARVGRLEGVTDFSFKIEMAPVFLRDLSTITNAINTLSGALSNGVQDGWISKNEARALFRQSLQQIGPLPTVPEELEENDMNSDEQAPSGGPFDYQAEMERAYQNARDAERQADEEENGNEPEGENADDGESSTAEVA